MAISGLQRIGGYERLDERLVKLADYYSWAPASG